MAAILEVDDSMNNTFIQASAGSDIKCLWSFACMALSSKHARLAHVASLVLVATANHNQLDRQLTREAVNNWMLSM